MPICATAEGTTRYRNRFSERVAPHHFRLARSLTLASIGIGTYLGDPDERTDANYTEAIVRAVELGVNVIDSAANYRFQRSERSIGSALNLLFSDGFERDEIVICTKGGYLPFDGVPPHDVRGYVEKAFVRPGIASFDDFVGGSHCMTPAYLQNQLEQSLANMGVDCVDLYYIHNPESQLPHVSVAEFEHRLSLAFEMLEQNRAAGRIKFYGVATWNGFRVAPSAREYHSFSRMIELAQKTGGNDHGFRFIQLPFNLAMAEALTMVNQSVSGKDMTLIEAATELGVAVMASASMLHGRVAQRLPDDLRQALGNLATDAQSAIQFVRSIPGLTTALVGMSQPQHVEENMQLATVEPLTKEEFERLFLQ
ncbi:MAG: aldo/keto reductase [Pyrinomonadaceae bacterium]